MSTEDQSAPPARKKGRSPSYPANPLDVCIDRAKTLFEREGRHAAPIAAIQESFGYKPNTGPANVALASLKKFGLLTDEGAGAMRTGRLTSLAIDIITHPDPRSLIAEAALIPPIHRELWEQYEGSLPSDATLLHELISRREFTRTGATEFVAQLRKTIDFADLANYADADVDNQAGTGEAVGVKPTDFDRLFGVPEGSPAGGSRDRTSEPSGKASYRIPVVGGPALEFSGVFPISEAAWSQAMAILAAMKPALVKADSAENQV